METKFKRLDHKSLVALLLVITRMIKADSRIDAGEIQKLMVLEQQYNFDHTLMTEANRLTLSDAIKQLRSLDLPTRRQILQSLTELGSTDRILELAINRVVIDETPMVLVHGRESLKTSIGTVNTVKVEPVLDGDGIFNSKGRIFIWLTDDDRRIPVLMQCEIALGSIKAKLIKAE